MEVSPSFELILDRGNTFLWTDEVRLSTDAPKRTTPVHFHPQTELVWFRKVAGSVLLDGRSYPLRDRQAVLLPSMQVHAFDTGTGPRSWVLLQFEPYLVESLHEEAPQLAGGSPLILSPDPEASARIDFLCDWLCAISTLPDRVREAQQVTTLILVALMAASSTVGTSIHSVRPHPLPLRDALRRIHADPRTAPTVSEAARTARVTDAHFSRTFKARIGIGYAAYVQIHRLNVAARQLLTEEAPVSQIAYGVGFSSAAYFSTLFAERFGLSPSEFRQRAPFTALASQDGERE